jgi:spore coat protein CotH
MFGRDIKKPYKIDFNHFESKNLDGLTSINLSNEAFDPTLMRERLTFALFRDGGAPAPRTAYALVYLTVPGLHDHKLAGLYTAIEEINKAFLKEHFGSDRGLLLKPENAFNLPYLGNDPAKYEKLYRPKTTKNIPPAAWQRLFDFLQLIHSADDATFEKTIDTYLDMDAFLRFIALNALTSNMDSFLSTSHNFYIYIHPDTLKIHFIPWDTNLSFGTFDWVGSTKEQTELSIRQPYVKPNKLLERILKDERFAKPYRREIDRLLQTCFNPTHISARIEAYDRLIADAYRAAKVTPATQPTTLPIKSDIRTFVQLRYASLRAQRDGTSDGYAPYWQRGFFGGGNAAKPATQPATRPAAPATQPAEKR